MRRHGLQAPLDPHQLASWVVFFALASGVYAFYVPFVEDAGVKWFLVALYSVLVAAIVALDLYTSSLDPSDPGLTGATDGEFFCGLCQASVARSSKHCRACDRCVEGFDHHCKWLNNCVGARNYWHFFGLISSTVSLLVLQLAWGLWLFIRSFTEKREMRALVADKYGKSVAYGGWQAALAIYMVLLITSVIMLGELLFFHIVLISKGLTTYDYIIAQRDAKLAAPPVRSGNNLKACRSSKVADTATAKRKVRVGINPCAAMRTSKPVGGPAAATASYDAAKAAAADGKAAGADGAAPTTCPSTFGKSALDGVGSGSLGSSSVDPKEGLRISDKATAAGSVQEMVARAVAEQTVFAQQASLREAAILRDGPGAVGGGGGGGGSGCVPECGGTGSSGGGASPAGGMASSSQDFTPLVQQQQQQNCQHQHHQQRQCQHQHHQGACAAAASGGTGPAPGPLPAAPGPLRDVGRPGALGKGGSGGFDVAAAPPAGRHLGGHPASPGGTPGAAAAPGSPLPAGPAVPLSRPNSLPPLVSAPSLPCPAPSGGKASRSLLFPAKSKSPTGVAAGSRRELAATPE